MRETHRPHRYLNTGDETVDGHTGLMESPWCPVRNRDVEVRVSGGTECTKMAKARLLWIRCATRVFVCLGMTEKGHLKGITFFQKLAKLRI